MFTETSDIIDLGTRHLEGALALSEEAHWNQVAADWRMLISAGSAIGIEGPDGWLIASALALPYGDAFGWVSMVLVTKDWQRKGLATRLLQSCIERLEGTGLTPVLDATPAGEGVYRPLGFLPHFGFQRWVHDDVESIAAPLPELQAISRSEIKQLDEEIFGGDRGVVLDDLIKRSVKFSCMDAKATGYLLGRDGRVASQIGPVLASCTSDALEMLDYALTDLSGRVFIDACDHQPEFVSRLTQYGFTPQRSFLRMAKGQENSFGDPSRMFAMAGPELG